MLQYIKREERRFVAMERGFSLLIPPYETHVSRDRRLMTGILFISTWRVPIVRGNLLRALPSGTLPCLHHANIRRVNEAINECEQPRPS